ncbi:response regulator transcription factor [Noviherbaspirillum pedocola]|uniref:Response regulator transcription factor n=1 Tax=Noviherbaspirillum pedocola TaxID=2801341 RepID=A0A934W8S8_9BURK|nr:response regulator transcription factor [Noviherbaspirillum pedocola]MBK4737158.1 response regulator transcription factor [Noviherbaspirillum pedocola]
MSRVLLVDDDVELVDMLREYLQQEGFDVDAVHDGMRGVEYALSGRYALAVLDVMMPGMTGMEALREIRARSALPVLMLTARGDDTDRIIGLELGADDYLPKPCNPRELAARVRAILRRAGTSDMASGDEPLTVGDLLLWPSQRRAQMDGRPLALTSSEFNLLEVLARHAGSPVSRADLSLQALGRPLARFDRNIDVHLSSLRQKLGKLPDGRSCIQTVYRQGYQLISG